MSLPEGAPAPRFPISFGDVLNADGLTPEEALQRVAKGLNELRQCEFTRTQWGLAFRVIWFAGFYSSRNPLARVSGGHLHAEARGSGSAVHYVIRRSALGWLGWLQLVAGAVVLLFVAGWPPALLFSMVFAVVHALSDSFAHSALHDRLALQLRGPR